MTRAARAIKIACDNREQKSYRVKIYSYLGFILLKCVLRFMNQSINLQQRTNSEKGKIEINKTLKLETDVTARL